MMAFLTCLWILATLIMAPILVGHDMPELRKRSTGSFVLAIAIIIWAWPIILLYRVGKNMAEENERRAKRDRY